MVFDAGDEKFRVIPLPYRCIDFTIEGIAELSWEDAYFPPLTRYDDSIVPVRRFFRDMFTGRKIDLSLLLEIFFQTKISLMTLDSC